MPTLSDPKDEMVPSVLLEDIHLLVFISFESDSTASLFFLNIPCSSSTMLLLNPTPPFKLEGTEERPNLQRQREWEGPDKGLVKMSAS